MTLFIMFCWFQSKIFTCFWNSLKENYCFPITKMQILVFVKKLTKNFTMFSCLFLLKIFGNCAFAHIMSEICKWIQVEKFLYQKPADLYNLKVHVHFKMYSAVQKNESKVLHTTEVRKFWNIFLPISKKNGSKIEF